MMSAVPKNPEELGKSAAEASKLMIECMMNLGQKCEAIKGVDPDKLHSAVDAASVMTGYGSAMLTALTVIAVASLGFMHALKGEGLPKLLGEYAMVLFNWGIAAAFIGAAGSDGKMLPINFGTHANGSPMTLVESINSGFDGIAAQVSGMGTAVSQTESIMTMVGKATYTAMTILTGGNKVSDASVKKAEDAAEAQRAQEEAASAPIGGM